MRIAQVYERKGKLYVVPYARTTTRGLINAEPVLIANADDTPEHKGQQVLAALERFSEGVPHPTDWKAVIKPLLDAAQVGSNGAFVKGTRSVAVRSDGDTMELVPTRNKGATGGFMDIKESTLVLHAPSASDVGEGLNEALSRALRD